MDNLRILTLAAIFITFNAVEVLGQAAPPITNINGTVCAGDNAQFRVTTSCTIQQWTASSGGVIQGANNQAVVFVNWSAASSNAWVQVTYSNCSTSFLALTVNAKTTPSVSISLSATTICQPQTITLQASPINVSGSPNYGWYIDSQLVATTTTTNYSYSASSLTSGTHNASVTISAMSCSNLPTVSAIPVNFTVNPSVGQVSAPSGILTRYIGAGGDTYSASATNATGYVWSIAAAPGYTGIPGSITGTSTSGSVSWSSTFSGVARVTVVANGCNGSTSTAFTDVTVNSLCSFSGTLTPNYLCTGSEVELRICTNPPNVNSTFVIYNGTNSYVGSIVSGGACLLTVRWLNVASGSYTLKIDNSVCSSYTVSVAPPSLPAVTISTSPSPNICAGQPITLMGGGTNIQSFSWNTTPTQTTTNITVTPVSNTTYTVTGTDDCGRLSTSSIPVNVAPIPTVTASPITQTICSGSTTSIVLTNTIASTVNEWAMSSPSVTGLLNGSGTSSPTSPYTYSLTQTLNTSSTVNGIATYAITPKANNCQGAPITVSVTVVPTPTASYAGLDRTVATTCGLMLAGNTPGVGTGTWSYVGSGVGGTIGNPLSPTSTFNGTAGSTYTLKWTITNGITCPESSDNVVITFNNNLAAANAGPDQTGATTCGLTSISLAGNAPIPTAGTGTWSIVPGSAVGGIITSPSSSISTFSGVAGSMYTLRWTINNSPCLPTSDSVIIKFNQNPSTVPTVVGNTRFGPGALTLTASGAPSGGTYNWYNPSNVLTGTGSTDTTDIISVNTPNYGYIKSVSSAGCLSSPVWVSLTIVPLPVITSSNNRVIMGANVILDTGPGYSSFNWKNSAGASKDTTQTFGTNEADYYTVTVTSNGVSGSGTSMPYQVINQFNGLNMNYIIANTILVGNISNESSTTNLTVDQLSQTVQYFDGLGRPIQSVNTQGSPLKQDVVQPIVYDAFGREYRKYLPVTYEANGIYKAGLLDVSGNYTVSFYNNSSDKIADDPVPYAEIVFEPSPLNRVLKQGAPGQAWQPINPNGDIYSMADHTVKKRYQTNMDNEVLLFNYDPLTGLVGLPPLIADQYYLANQLYANKTYDEHNNDVIEYVDKEGRTVCKKVKVNATAYASTYYIYDDFGNLVVVLPPQAVEELINAQN
ncbi:MAG: DUF6443 domain-containing protein [Bacteroidota bacterium]